MRHLFLLVIFALLTACQITPPPPPSPTDDRFDPRVEGVWRSLTDSELTAEIRRTTDGQRYVIRMQSGEAERRFRADLVRLEGADFVVVEVRGPSMGVLHFPLMLEIEGDEMMIRLPRTDVLGARLLEAGREVEAWCGEWGDQEFCAPTLDAPPREVLALLEVEGPETYFEDGEAWRRVVNGRS